MKKEKVFRTFGEFHSAYYPKPTLANLESFLKHELKEAGKDSLQEKRIPKIKYSLLKDFDAETGLIKINQKAFNEYSDSCIPVRITKGIKEFYSGRNFIVSDFSYENGREKIFADNEKEEKHYSICVERKGSSFDVFVSRQFVLS